MKDYKLQVRASQVSKLITNDRTGKSMGDTAKNLIRSIAIQDVFGLKTEISSKEIKKGITLENDAIELLNLVEFKQYKKNTARVVCNGFSGECDIDSISESLIRDIKCAWSHDTFSWTKDELFAKSKKSGYEEQLRTYMMLYDRDNAKLDEILLTTPIELIPDYMDFDLFDYDEIPMQKRITTIEYKRNKDWESALMERYKEASIYYDNYVQQILNK
jgi:hypothetical protein